MPRKKTGEPPAAGGEGDGGEQDAGNGELTIEQLQKELADEKAAREADAALLKEIKDERERASKAAAEAKAKADAEAKAKMTASEKLTEYEKELERVKAELATTSSILAQRVEKEQAAAEAEKMEISRKINEVNPSLSVEMLMKCDITFLNQLTQSSVAPVQQSVDAKVKTMVEDREARIAAFRAERDEKLKRRK